MKYTILISLLLMMGCVSSPKIIEKPVYQKIVRYPIPERTPPKKLNEKYGPFETKENSRKHLYNIADSETYILDLLVVIHYYENYILRTSYKDCGPEEQTAGVCAIE